MYTDRLMANCWRGWFSPEWDTENKLPAITLSFMPISHVMGRVILYSTLGAGGTAYFAAKSDLSTLLEDLSLVRPTKLDFVPRIWEMLFQEVQSETDRRAGALDDADRAAVEQEVMAEQRTSLVGGRRVLGDHRLGADLARAALLDRGLRRRPRAGRLRLHRGRRRARRRRDPTATGGRLQAGGRPRARLLRHRSPTCPW